MTRKPLILALLGVLVVTTPGFTQVLLDPSVDPLAQGYQTLGTAPYQPGTFLAIDDASTADRRTFFKTIPEIATSAFAVETNIMIDSSFVLVDSSGDTGVRVILSDGMLQVAATLVQINNERRIALVRLNGTFTVGFLMDWTVFQTVHLERTADGRAILTVGSHREVLFPEELPLASRASPYLEFGAASSPAAVRVLFDAIRQVAPSNVPGPGTPPPLAGVRLPIMTLPSNQPVLTGARGVAVDRDGNIHVVLRENVPPAIVKLDATGREIWRIGSRCDASSGFGCADPDGSGPLQLGDGQFEQPMGLAVDGNGRVYVSDFSNMNIQVFDSDGRFLFKFGSFCGPDGFGCVDPDGTGPLEAGDGQFCNPAGIAVNGAGQIYVVDNCLSRIQVFDSTGRFLFKFGARGSGPGQFGFAGGLGNVAVDGADRVYVADDGNSRIQVFDPDGTFRFAFGAPGTGDGQFERPFGLAIDGAGSIYVTDFMKPRVQKFDALGRFVSSFGSKCLLTTGQGCVDPDGAGPLELGDGQFSGPASVATDAGGLVYVVDGGELANHRVEVFDSSGRFLTKLGAFSPSPGRFTFPRTVALDGADRIYVLDVAAAGTDRVQVFDTAGAPISAFGYRSQLGNVSDMTVDGPGTVYLADTFYNSRILKFDASGALGGNFGFFGAGTGFISAFGAARPERIRLDQAGNLYVQSASMVQKFDPSGRQLQRIAPVTTQFAFSTVSDVAVDGGGRVYVAESVMSATFPIIHSLKV